MFSIVELHIEAVQSTRANVTCVMNSPPHAVQSITIILCGCVH